jgi:hypothetical protein
LNPDVKNACIRAMFSLVIVSRAAKEPANDEHHAARFEKLVYT